MEIRLANQSDLVNIDAIYESARKFMRDTGNPDQWSTHYPSVDLIKSDIESSNLYTVCENDEILAVFFFKIGEDPTYQIINGGKWKNDLPYGVIHRIAVAENAHGKGVSSFCFDFALSECGNLKIDTHRDNLPMQKVLKKNGFEYCGIINLENGDERLAFQKSK